MESLTQRIAMRLGNHMKDQKVSQTVVAAHLHMSQAALSRRLLGRVEFRPSEVEAVAALMGVPVADLVAEVNA